MAGNKRFLSSESPLLSAIRVSICILLIHAATEVKSQSITFEELVDIYNNSETKLHQVLTLKGFTYIQTTYWPNEKQYPQISYGKGELSGSFYNQYQEEMLFGISADFTDRTKKMKYVNYTMVSGEIFDGVCTKILELYTPGYKYKRPEPGLESEIHIPGKDYDVIMKIDKSLDGTYSYNIGLAGYIK